MMDTIDKGGDSSPDWWSPPEVVDSGRRVMGGIDLDPASCAEANRLCVRADSYYDRGQNGLLRDWNGRLWFNPPYERGSMPQWTGKLLQEIGASRTVSCIALVNSDPSTQWFQALATRSSVIGFPMSRICFVEGRPDHPNYGVQAPGGQQRPQAIMGIHVNRDVFMREYRWLCWFAIPRF